MKLRNAAKYFDRDFVYDGYTGIFLFKGQFSSFEGSNPDGSFNRRRTVSVAPAVDAAPRRVVSVLGNLWIMGEFVTDGFNGRAIRKNASAKEATDLFTILTPGQAALRDQVGNAHAYGHRDYLKVTVNTGTESAYTPQYEVYFSITETIPEGTFLRSDKSYLHVRSVQFANEGYWVGIADQIANTAQPGSVEVTVTTTGQFDPRTETYAPGIQTTGLMIDMYQLYDYQTEADPRNEPGDMTLVVAKSAVDASAGQELQIDGVVWRNVGYTENQDAWNIHVRRA